MCPTCVRNILYAVRNGKIIKLNTVVLSYLSYIAVQKLCKLCLGYVCKSTVCIKCTDDQPDIENASIHKLGAKRTFSVSCLRVLFNQKCIEKFSCLALRIVYVWYSVLPCWTSIYVFEHLNVNLEQLPVKMCHVNRRWFMVMFYITIIEMKSDHLLKCEKKNLCNCYTIWK